MFKEKSKDLEAWGILIDEIPLEGLTVSFENLVAFGEDLKVVKPFSGELKLVKRAYEVNVSGHLKGTLELICDKCLEPFLYEIDKDFQVLLLPKSSLNVEGEKGLSEEELEISFYENSFISYYEIIKEEILLSLPYRSLCREDCKGICQVCGTNLNKETCMCSKVKKSSPFAVLKELFGEKGEKKENQMGKEG